MQVTRLLFALALVAGCAAPHAGGDVESTVVPGQVAPRLQSLGDHTHPITTRSARAQLFFDQGLVLSWGFNHLEAGRSFREAARLDPDAAMAWWGQALVLGPNINAPMNPADEPVAFELIQQAVAREAGVSERERDYIDALAKRYSGEAAPDRAALDRAYADAMGALHRKYPDDLDAATLYAEALMNLRPWNYWAPDLRPYAETPEIIAVLESVSTRDPGHVGANHMLIHVFEASEPRRAEAAADRLLDAAPGAGHLQHMPSHIYVRVGRYADASASNEKAIAADVDYLAACRAQGAYPLAYYPHNIHFLWWSSSWEGRSAQALASAREVEERSREHLAHLPAFGQIFPVSALYTLVRFGRWDGILAEPEPAAEWPYWRGIWHYARGIAFARTARFGQAKAELAALDRLAADPAVAGVVIGGNTTGALLGLARSVLAGELLAERGQLDAAIAELHRAVLLQDGLVYIEPADWYYPVRQSLGAVLLEADRPAEAERIYWQDLRENPENGWSLFGLAQSLRAQGRHAEADEVTARFEKAWARADVVLPASRF